MFYLVRCNYLGEKHRQHGRRRPSEILISTIPGRTNIRGEEITDGWLGQSLGPFSVDRTACGAFETIEEARAAAAALGYPRRYDLDLTESGPDIVEAAREPLAETPPPARAGGGD